MDKKHLNRIFKRAIRKAGSQAKLANRLEVTRQMINKVVKGKTPVPSSWLTQLSDIAGV